MKYYYPCILSSSKSSFCNRESMNPSSLFKHVLLVWFPPHWISAAPVVHEAKQSEYVLKCKRMENECCPPHITDSFPPVRLISATALWSLPCLGCLLTRFGPSMEVLLGALGEGGCVAPWLSDAVAVGPMSVLWGGPGGVSLPDSGPPRLGPASPWTLELHFSLLLV